MEEITLAYLMSLPAERRNELFHNLSKEERAVLVAQDVLAQIAAKKYTTVANTYVMITQSKQDLRDYDSFSKPLQPIAEEASCKVCAIGAAFMSTVRLGNKATVSNVAANLSGVYIGIASVAFTEGELRAMEVVVENSFVHSVFHGVAVIDALSKYRKQLVGRYNGGNERTTKMVVKALMKNIINNGGKLVVPGLSVDLDDNIREYHEMQAERNARIRRELDAANWKNPTAIASVE